MPVNWPAAAATCLYRVRVVTALSDSWVSRPIYLHTPVTFTVMWEPGARAPTGRTTSRRFMGRVLSHLTVGHSKRMAVILMSWTSIVPLPLMVSMTIPTPPDQSCTDIVSILSVGADAVRTERKPAATMANVATSMTTSRVFLKGRPGHIPTWGWHLISTAPDLG
jgi:hypothetical protein